MKNLMIQAITENGCIVYASINVKNDYSMNEVVNTVKSNGYIAFTLIDTMRVFVRV